MVDMPVEKLREVMERAEVPFLPKDIVREAVTAPVQGEWHRPQAFAENGASGARGPMVLYFHGGGYVFGSPATHQSLTFALAKKTGAPVFSSIYRLAPEHPCPAAIDDAVATYEWLLSEGRQASKIVIGGDSAGGGLSMALLQALKEKGRPLPAGAFLYSPWVDLKDGGPSMEENAESDVMFQTQNIRRGAARYAGALALDDPRVSPVYGDFEGLPPLQVFVSKSEMLRDSATLLIEKAKDAGVSVEVISKDELAHVWPVFTPLMPEAVKAVDQTVAFIKDRWAGEAS